MVVNKIRQGNRSQSENGKRLKQTHWAEKHQGDKSPTKFVIFGCWAGRFLFRSPNGVEGRLKITGFAMAEGRRDFVGL